MPRLSDTERSVLGGWIWPYLTAAAASGFTASRVQAGIAGIAEENDVRLSFEQYTSIATLYGYARRMDNAAQAFQGADLNAVLTPDMMGVPPWARDEAEMNALPKFHGTFEFTYIDQAGNMQTDFRTSGWDMTIPDTVGGVINDMQADAEAMALKYEVELVSVNPIQILAV